MDEKDKKLINGLEALVEYCENTACAECKIDDFCDTLAGGILADYLTDWIQKIKLKDA